METYFRENRLRQYSQIHGREPLCAAICRSRCSDRPNDWVQIGQAYRLEVFVEGGDVDTEMDPFTDIVTLFK